MKNSKLISLLLIASVALMPSCKKKSTDPVADPTPTPPTTSVICDGNGTSTFFPMALNDKWNYNWIVGTQTQSVQAKLIITGNTTHGSNAYFKIEDQSGAMYAMGSVEFRDDAITHNIYYYDSNSSSEFLYIPSTPILNQSWTYAYNYSRKVTNLNASISTASCSYTGLLEITVYNSSNALNKKEYFKKGAGLVYREDPSAFGTGKYNLTTITLQ